MSTVSFTHVGLLGIAVDSFRFSVLQKNILGFYAVFATSSLLQHILG
jgi:hypothetical protein